MQYGGRDSAHSNYASKLAPPSSAREELFYGSPPPAARPPQGSQGGGLVPADHEAMNNGQLMQQAVEQHKDTTATARRALQTVENMKNIQGSTMEALKDQGEQMKRVEQDFDKMGSELTYAQRVLRAMRVCCCADILCPCLTEPKRDAAADADWRRTSASGGGNQPGGYAPGGVQMQAPRQQQQPGMAAESTYANPNTDGLTDLGFGNQAKVLDNETQKQNQYLDEISKGLDQLKHGAATMNEELARQEGDVARLQHDAQQLGGRLNNVNRDGFRGL